MKHSRCTRSCVARRREGVRLCPALCLATSYLSYARLIGPQELENMTDAVAACEEFGIELRVCHTPGALLDRPDQTSRGDPVEEPRLRQRLATRRG